MKLKPNLILLLTAMLLASCMPSCSPTQALARVGVGLVGLRTSNPPPSALMAGPPQSRYEAAWRAREEKLLLQIGRGE